MGSAGSSRPLVLGVALVALVGALAALFWWADRPDAPPPVVTVDRLPAVPARLPERPDGGGFRPHPDRAGLRPLTPPE